MKDIFTRRDVSLPKDFKILTPAEEDIKQTYSELLSIVKILNKIDIRIDRMISKRSYSEDDLNELRILITSLSTQGNNIGHYC